MTASVVFLAAGLLAWSGGAKLWRPEAAARSLSVSGLPVPRPRTVVRAMGIVEVGVGLACLLAPGRAAPAALAVLYLAFALYLMSLLVRRVPAASCGCFGRQDVQPSILHVVVDLVAAGAGLAAVLEPPPSLWSVLGGLPWNGVPFVAGLVAAGYLVVLAETHLPALFFSYRRGTVP